MSRPIYQYKPINDRPDKSLGILLPFNKSANGRSSTQNYSSGSLSGGSVFVQSYTTSEQAITNLRNLLLTGKGERYLQPEFGTRIRYFLFEQITDNTINDLQNSLEEDIARWLPYINVKNIDILEDPDRNSILIRLFFSVNNIGANLVINILANENQLIVSEPEEIALTRVGILRDFNGFS